MTTDADFPKCSTETRRDRIAVIGAGLAGIVTIVSLKEEGFEPVCYEASDSHGGLWNYKEESVEGFASLMPATVLNSSKEMGAFSNFPPDKEYSNYMHHRKFFQYLTEYYNHNGCEKYVRLNTEVTNVKKAEDYESTGRLSVTVRDKLSGQVSTDIFDGVMVATGHFTYPNKVHFPGLEKFKGKVIHTHSLKHVEEYKNKNVLVIGMGCSALDAAENISYVCNQVYLSSRNGAFVSGRVSINGYPVDYTSFRRCNSFFTKIFPIDFLSRVGEIFYIEPKFDHRLFYVKPKYRVLNRDPTVNDALFPKLLSGIIKQVADIKYFTENGVVFQGEETVTQVDAVVMGTGYTFKFPFLEDGLLEIENGRINVYKTVFPTHLPHPTLAFIGFMNPYGAGFPIDEIQSRWVTRIFAGKENLPSNDDMLKELMRFHAENERRFAPNEHMSIRVDQWSYLDDIAEKIGCMPNLLKYLFTDPRLFLRLVFGPLLPYQYRLDGPHKWDGAREAIMTCDDRVIWPLTRDRRSDKGWVQYILEYIGAIVPRNVFIP